MTQFGQIPGQPSPNSGKKYPPEPLTPEEVQAVIGQCSSIAPTGIRNRALLTLLYRSGLRISEVLSVRAADLNWKQHSVRLLDTKTGEAQTRGFHPSADDALLRWLDVRKNLGIRTGPLFCTLRGTPLSDDYVRGMLKRLARKAGIEKRVHPHGLRHTFAAELDAASRPWTEISSLLGHRNLTTTAVYLKHLTNAQAIASLQSAELPELNASA